MPITLTNLMKGTKTVPLLLLSILSLPLSYAQAPGHDTLELQLHALNLNLIYITLAIIGVISAGIVVYKKQFEKSDKIKTILFTIIVLAVLGTSTFVAGSTIYLNVNSETKGPVHWHADYEIWACGKKLDLTDPRGLSNRIGTPTFHEHNDDRVHVEGVVVKKHEVSLKTYFSVIGGDLEKGRMRYPTTEGSKEFNDGEFCNGQRSKLQMWVYSVKNPGDHENWIYEVKKINDYPSYILSPQTLVPPGDCFILEFGPEKPTTNKICETYKVSESRGEMRGS